MTRETPNFLEGLVPSDYEYLGGDFEMPTAGFAGWHETLDGHSLPYQVIGDLEDSDKVVILQHGGPGDTSRVGDIAPLLGIQGVAVLAYNQRLSGAGNKVSDYNGASVDPLETHSPELLVGDIEAMRSEILGDRAVNHFGVSWGTALSLLHGEAYPEAIDGGMLLSGVTLARTQESLARYDASGADSLAQIRPEEFARFINAIPEPLRSRVEDDPLEIVKSYDSGMNPKSEDYNEATAKELAVAFGLLHLTAADPEGIGNMRIDDKKLVELSTDQVYGLAQMLGMRPALYASVAMRSFAEHFPRIGQGEGDIVNKIGRLAGKSLYIVSGGADPLTPTSASSDLMLAAERAGVGATLTTVDGGYHSRNQTSMQNAIRQNALALLAS